MFRYFARLILLLGGAGAFVLVIMLILAISARRGADVRAGELVASDSNVQTGLPFTITLAPVAVSGLSNPVYLTHAGDGSGRLFVVEQVGKIHIIKNGVLLPTPYLDISSQVSCCGERGLLSIAFDPAFKTNGTFYVDYTDSLGNTVVKRYVVSSPSSDTATPTEVTTILHVIQPQPNHNGGQLQFGKNDDDLYVSLGDGGGADDVGSGHAPEGNGQSLGTLLGKILRINVRGVPTYTIPSSNPFTQTAGALGEIWAYGLRNPWRFSFDRGNSDMYIADVGQDCYEEVDYQPAASHGGENYGWRLMEGFHAFDPNDPFNCSQPTLTLPGIVLPITDYNHSLGEAVIGGYVYRGHDYPWMDGAYFFGDEVSGRVWIVEQSSPGNWVRTEELDTPYHISSFGEGEDGELYVVNLDGGIYKIASSKPADLSGTTKQASPSAPRTGDVLTYTIVLRNSGNSFSNTIRLTDTVPGGLIYRSGSFTATVGAPDATLAPTLTWTGHLSNTNAVTLTYTVTVSAATAQAISNLVAIDAGIMAPFTRTAVVVVNGLQVYLPLVFKDY